MMARRVASCPWMRTLRARVLRLKRRGDLDWQATFPGEPNPGIVCSWAIKQSCCAGVSDLGERWLIHAPLLQNL